jgi:hypothetical protein
MSQATSKWLCSALAADAAILALAGSAENVFVAEPEERATLGDSQPALVVVREENEQPASLGSQLGIEEVTVWIEARSLTKQTVHDLKARAKALLADKQGRLDDGTIVQRTRYDWGRGPYLNEDGATWEAQLRFILKTN